MTDNTELKRLAEAATPGPWSVCGEVDSTQGFEIVQDIWNEHGTHTGMDVVVYEWSYESDPLGVIRRPDADFIAAANPSAVLALIAEIERLQGCEDVLRQLASHVGAGGYNAPEVDPETFARKIMDGINILNDPMAQLVIKKGEQIDQLRAEVAGLRTGYEAYERVNAELKGQVEAMKKRIDDMSPFKGAPFTGPNTKCLACGGYHYGMGGLPCPNMRITAQADLPETRSGQIGAALGQGDRGGQSTSKTSQSADPEGSKGGGQ